MKERPILFKGEMVRAIIEGRKTETRRPITNLVGLRAVTEFQASDTIGYDFIMRDRRMLWNDFKEADVIARCPYGVVGDRLWVRETWAPADWWFTGYELEEPASVRYRADGAALAFSGHPGDGPFVIATEGWTEPKHWRPSIHMPRWACRLVLEMVSVRLERLRDIDEAGALAEGVTPEGGNGLHDPCATHSIGDHRGITARGTFAQVWDAVYKGHGWDVNPWVWVVSFKRVDGA